MSIPMKAIQAGNFFGYNDYKAKRAKEEEDPLCFATAVDRWGEHMLTGELPFTDEEKEMIREAIANWLKENSLESDEEKMAFRMFVKELYRAFGSRSDFFDFIASEIKSQWLEENPIVTPECELRFAKFTRRVDSVLGELEALSLRSANNGRPLINFAGEEADITPTRIYPLQQQHHQHLV